MPMRIWQGEEGGWPYIESNQEVPDGRSIGGWAQAIMLKATLVISLCVAASVSFSGFSTTDAAIAGLLVWGLFNGGGKVLQGMMLPGGYGRTPILPPVSDAERRAEAIERATPMMTSERVRAAIKVALNAQGQLVPFLAITTTPKSKKPIALQVPIEDIREFSLGTDEDVVSETSPCARLTAPRDGLQVRT